MKSKFFTLLILVSVLLATTAYTQTQEIEKEKTIEDLYLQNVELGIIAEMVNSESRKSKLDALSAIEDMISDSINDSDNRKMLVLLGDLSMEGNRLQDRKEGLLINNFPLVRRKACELLGEIGGKLAKRMLLDVLSTEKEPMVLAEVAYALGRIGSNENNEVSQSLSNSVIDQDSIVPDNNYAFAVLFAFEKIAESNGGISDPTAFRALVKIQNGNYIKPVQKKAKSVIDKLKAYKYNH